MGYIFTTINCKAFNLFFVCKKTDSSSLRAMKLQNKIINLPSTPILDNVSVFHTCWYS